MHPQGQGCAKRAGQPLSHVNEVSGLDGRDNFLLYVYDNRMEEKWLVDGGAIISIIPPTADHIASGPTGESLRAANGTIISCYGSSYRTLSIGGKDFPFEFTVAAVNQRIIGADFLANFHLAPNHRDAKLLSLKDFSTLPAQHAIGAKSLQANHIAQADDPYYRLLDTFPEILTPSFKMAEPAHGVRHHIPTTGSPVQSRARRLDQEKLAVAKAELLKLEELGICYRGKSEWASPLLVTPKPCGGWRVCGDYRRLNGMTGTDQYPVRQLTDFTAELHNKSIFSKIDLLKGYHQIPVAVDDVQKTAVITPFGLFIFPRTPFGLKNAGQDFQRLMDEILGDIPRVFVYIDDILVASENPEQHLKDLEIVFKTLAENGMVVQRPKCVLGKDSLEFLGYQVDSTGITPLKNRVTAIEQTKPPTTVKELQRFLEMVGYYRRFIPNSAACLFHLFNALKGKPKTLEWTADCQRSFDDTKAALAAATLLHHPRPGAQLALTTDASNTAIGGVLEQRGPRGWEPLAFWSAKLEPNQRLWPPYDRELLAAFRGCRHFRSWIEGRPFTLFTDHQSLVPSIHKKTDPQTLRQTYQLSCVSEYTTDIRYIEGKSNVVADALSRPNEDPLEVLNVNEAATSSRQERLSTTASFDQQQPPPVAKGAHFLTSQSTTSSTNSSSTLPSTGYASQPHLQAVGPPNTELEENRTSLRAGDSTSHRSASAAKSEVAVSDLNCVINAIGDLGLDWDEIAAQQALDPDFRKLRQETRTGLHFKSIDIGTRSIIVDVSNGPARPWIPFSHRKKVFDCLHGLGHPGVERTRQMVAEKVVWPSMRADVTKWARECLSCQRSKVIRHTVPPISEFTIPDKRFNHIHMDLVSMPPSNGYRYLLTIVDRFTRWPVAIPLVDISTQTIIDAFAFGWVQTYGVPATITTDRGAQFTSALFKQLTTTWGIKLIHTTAFHPEANGMVERLHRRLKESLLAADADRPEDWFWRLPCVMLSLRTTLKPDIGASPSDLVYGEGLAVPGDLLPTNPSSDPQLSRQREAALADLRLEVARLQPIPTSAHRRPHIHIPEALETCTHVFIRRDNNDHQTLSPPYNGPYKVLARNAVNFKVDIPGRSHEVIAISRVKPALSSTLEPGEDAAPPQQPLRRPHRQSRQPFSPAAEREDQRPPSQQPRRRSRRASQPPRQRTPTPPSEPQSPPVRRRVPRGRALPLSDEDEVQPPPPSPPPQEVQHDFPLDYDVPVDEIPEWHPPPWFQTTPDRDADPEPGAETHAPPPPPPPKRRGKRKQGNPNWVKGGSMAGSRWYNDRPRPDVTAIFSHLGIPYPSRAPSESHECNSNCEY